MKANGETFDIYPYITKCALDIICETAMGTSINAMSSNRNQYVESIYAISEIITWRFFRPYITDFIFQFTPKGYAFQKHLKQVHNFTRKVVAERKKHLKDNNLNNESKANKANNKLLGKKERMSFLDLLLNSSESSDVLNDQDIAEEVDTFMFEGHDTTTAGMCWTLFLLGNNADIQEKVYQEVRNVLQNKSTPSTISELHEMKYLEGKSVSGST
ncbi:Cytochrome P450 [Popillia japonica]|uniref:Cytochrome P450 n=1 Tax=Popillia japonica TaxID=7064 RepID=A0AAW1MD26_POPJA